MSLQLYLEDNGLRGTGRILGLSNVTVLRGIFSGKYAGIRYEIQSKERKLWVWIAIDRCEQEVMVDTVGGRSKKA